MQNSCYMAVSFSKNKGLFHFCMGRAGKKNYVAAMLALLYVGLSLVSYTISGYAAYTIQNILYVAALIVLSVGLITVKIKV